MTFKEKLAMEHPEEIGDWVMGGCAGCPYGYNYEPFNYAIHSDCQSYRTEEKCRACWNREYKEENTMYVDTVVDGGGTGGSQYIHAVKTEDPVNKPSHYTYGNIECIDFIESCGFGEDFCLGNAVKYITRAEHKGTKLQDLKKAQWYLNRAISKLEEQ